MERFETIAYNVISKDYKPEKNSGAFDGKYIENKSEGVEKLSISGEQYLEKIEPYVIER